MTNDFAENIRAIGELISQSYYRRLFDFSVSLLRKTRIPILKRSNMWIGAMQMNMINHRIDFEKAIKEGKSRLKNKIGPKEDLRAGLESNKQLQRVLKDIGDGIAWRNLNYNRPIIRLMSENFPNKTISQDYERLKWHLGARRNWRDKVIINDLTHCLSIADLTVITDKSKIILYEIKGDKTIDLGEIILQFKQHKGKGWHRRQARQNIRHWIAQMAIIDKKIKTKNRNVNIIDLDFKVKTHIPEIKKLIRQADRKIFSTSLLEPGYFISILALDKLCKRKKEEIKQKIGTAMSFDPIKEGWSNLTLPLSNYDTFYHKISDRLKNFTPYSVLPLSAKNCVRLMMGQLFIQFYFDLEKLKEKFENAGWDVKVSNWKLMHHENKKIIKKIKSGKGLILDNMPKENIFTISKIDSRGTYTLEFSINLVFIMLSAFYKTDFLLDLVEEIYCSAKLRDNAIQLSTFNFIGEQKTLC